MGLDLCHEPFSLWPYRLLCPSLYVLRILYHLVLEYWLFVFFSGIDTHCLGPNSGIRKPLHVFGLHIDLQDHWNCCATQSYDIPFYLVGSVYGVAAMLILVTLFLQKN